MGTSNFDTLIERIWARDHTVWGPDQIADRLGWLTVASDLRERTAELRAIGRGAVDSGFERVVLLGMGGSSLAAQTIRRVFGPIDGAPDLVVLDTTHPSAVLRIERDGDLRRTLFVVASKSGTTIETLCHLQYFYGRIQRGDHFIVVTDPGSPLESLAQGHGFRGLFLNPGDIGGRFSALSLYGLVPASLTGVDPGSLLSAGIEMADRCRLPFAGNPGAQLGAFLAQSALAGKDKATFLLPKGLAPLGLWIEQLVAESTGKGGRGIVPVIGDAPGDRLGPDRALIDYSGESPFAVSPESLGAEFFRLEFATAFAASLLGVNAFDQPDVASAKEATNRIMSSGGPSDPGFDDPRRALDPLPSYLGILAYVDPSPSNEMALESARSRLRESLGVAVTAGFGPRYLHSTGQLHKGGPDGASFLMVVDGARAEDAGVPGRGYTFGTLIDAQSLGDLNALRARGRRVARITLQELASLG